MRFIAMLAVLGVGGCNPIMGVSVGVGATGGAAAGLIASDDGERGENAAIGAAIGAVAGVGIYYAMDALVNHTMKHHNCYGGCGAGASKRSRTPVR